MTEPVHRPPHPQPIASNARTSAPPSTAMPLRTGCRETYDAARVVVHAAVLDVRVLDRVDVDRAAVRVLRPAAGAGRAAAVERRRVVGLDRAEVASAVGLDRDDLPDREPRGVQAPEHRPQRARRRLVDDEPAGTAPAVEPPVADREQPEVAERDRAAGPPRDARHQCTLLRRERSDLPDEGRIGGNAAIADSQRHEPAGEQHRSPAQQVGTGRFELPASCSQSRRANQAALRPVTNQCTSTRGGG